MSEYVANINQTELKVQLKDDETASADKVNYKYELTELKKNSFILKLNEKQFRVEVINRNKESFELLINNTPVNVITRSALEQKAMKLIENANVQQHHHTELLSPMPGMILKIRKKKGDKIILGESLLILEAMKMENDIKSPVTGIIKEINVKEGSPVEKGVKLISIE